MLFNGSLWQFQNYFAQLSMQGVILFKFFNPIVQQLFYQKIKDKLGSYQLIDAMQLDRSKLEGWSENSLFFADDPLIIINGEYLHEQLALLIEKSQRTVIIFADSKYKFLPKFTVEIEGVKFFEERKLWSFFISELHLKIDRELFDYLLNNVPGDVRSIYETLLLLKTLHPITLSAVKKLGLATKRDQFALAQLLAAKKFKKFFHRLLQLEEEGDIYFILHFLLSYLAKMANYQQVSDNNKFNRQLKEYAAQWSSPSIYKMSKLIAQLIELSRVDQTMLKIKLQELTWQ